MKPKTLNQAIIQEQEREQHIEALSRLSEEMRNEGASQQSIHNAIIAYNKKLQATSTFKDPQQSYLDSITPSLLNQAPGIVLSLIPTKQTEWLWQQRIPLGHLTLLQGQPGIGTSLLATTIAARVTTGQPMPDDTPAKPGNVILNILHESNTPLDARTLTKESLQDYESIRRFKRAPLRSAEAPAHASCWRTRFPIPRTVYHPRSSLSGPAHLRYQHHPTQHPCPNCPNGKLFFKY